MSGMNGLLSQILSNVMMGKLQNHPLMGTVNQMLAGKNPQEQIQTLINLAKSKGMDVNAKMFSEEDLKSLGLK